MMNRKLMLTLFISLGAIGLLAFLPGEYTNWVIKNVRAKGEYTSAEEGMLALMDKYYSPDHEVKIYYAGPNADNGSQPYVWYVIAEVHASKRADGSEMGQNGCDAPGSFFLQLKNGKWVHIGEGLFTTFFTSWMDIFDLAGEGQTTPATDILNGPTQFCR
jgi:hypothetical protein